MSDPRPSRVPAWASLLNESRFARFDGLVRATLARSGHRVRFGEGCVEVELAAGTATLGLGNLLQVCHASPPDDWPGLIELHFEKLLTLGEVGRELPGQRLLGSFETARPALRVRLWPKAQLAVLPQIAQREDLPGLATTLVLDLPEDIRALTWDDVARLAVPVDRLFTCALENVLHCCPPARVRVDHQLPVVFLHSGKGDYFAASHALLLAHHRDCLGPHGAIFAVPHRHMVVVHPLHGMPETRALDHLAHFVRQCHEQGPNSIDPGLFRCFDGRHERFDAAARARFAAALTTRGDG